MLTYDKRKYLLQQLKKIDDDETIMKVCKQFGLQDMIERESETIDTQLGF